MRELRKKVQNGDLKNISISVKGKISFDIITKVDINFGNDTKKDVSVYTKEEDYNELDFDIRNLKIEITERVRWVIDNLMIMDWKILLHELIIKYFEKENNVSEIVFCGIDIIDWVI